MPHSWPTEGTWSPSSTPRPPCSSGPAGRLPGAAAVLGDLRTLQFGASFDAVVCRGVLNDLTADGDREVVIQVFARHLRPGGVLVLDVRDCESTARRYRDGRTAQRRLPLPAGS